MLKENKHVIHCPSCGTYYTGNFCFFCGEKAFFLSDLSLKKFFSQTIEVFTHFDTKFIRSLKRLIFFPGFLPKAYTTGITVNYARPMQVFLLVNIFFYFTTHVLLFVTDYSPSYIDYNTYQISNFWVFQWASGLDNAVAHAINQLGVWKQQQLGLSSKEFTDAFLENTSIYSKTFIILLIPLYSIVFWSFFSKRFKYFGSAVVFAIYFVAFQLIAFSASVIIIKGLKISFGNPFTWLFFQTPLAYVTDFIMQNGDRLQLITLLEWFPYLFIALQKINKKNRLLTGIGCLITCKILFYVTFGVYKKLLIVLTILLMQKH